MSERIVQGSSHGSSAGPWHAKVQHGERYPTHTACGLDLYDETHHMNDWNYTAHPEHTSTLCPSCVKLHPPKLEPYR